MANKKKIVPKKNISILSKKGNGFGILTYKVSTLVVFQELECYSEILTCSIVAVITIVNMVQIRAMRPMSSAQEVDTSDSYKLYKSRVIRNDPGVILKSCLAAAAVFPYLGETPEAVQEQLDSIISSKGANGKIVNSPPTKSNYALWTYGTIAQIGGIMNSCPATNPSVLGINQPLLLDVKEILKMFDLPGKPTYEEIIARTRNFFITNPVDGQVSDSFVFKEVFDGSKSITPLEEEILGESFIVREDASRLRIGASGSIPKNSPTPEDIVKYLSTFERTRYEQAGKMGARDVLISLNRKVMVAMAAEMATNLKGSPSENNIEEDILEVPDIDNDGIEQVRDIDVEVEVKPVENSGTTKHTTAPGTEKRNVRIRNQSMRSSG
jgi:hypothetical protein